MNTMSVQENAVLKEPRAGSWRRLMTGREEQVFLILTLIIGAVVGLIVVAFILLTERFGARLYPAGGAAGRRVLIPTIGSLGMGYLLFRFFPDARGTCCKRCARRRRHWMRLQPLRDAEAKTRASD